MTGLLIGLLTALAAADHTPVEKAQSLNTQGNETAEKGNEREAQRLYQESIAILRPLGTAYDAHTAGVLMNLGVSFSSDGQRPAATKIFEEALALHRRSLGATHRRTVTNINLLAINYLMLGDPARAEVLLKEALATERQFYPDDVQTAHTLDGMAYILMHGKDGRGALPLTEEALRISIRSTGENSLDTALAYATVAEAHRMCGSRERALPLYRQARWLYEKALGAESPRVASLLSQEGLILMMDGNLALAEQSMMQAVNMLRKACPDCAVELSVTQNNLGLLRLKQKRYREADEVLTSSAELREKFAVQPGPELADTLQLLALARQKLHRPDDAARLNDRAQSILGYR